jgi:glycosyltransferase involved in cell wall biosynthesis
MFNRLGVDKYDFVIVKDKFITGLFAIVASALFGSKFIYWLSYPFPEYYLNEYKEGRARYPFLYWIRGHVFKILLYSILLPLSDHVFLQTKQMLEQVASYGIPKGKMTAVPMAVSAEDIPYFGYNEKGCNGNLEKKVVYLGTLFKIRRIDFLIRVFEKVARRQKNVKLYLVGGGDDDRLDEQEIEHEARKLGIKDYVTITGFLPQREAWAFCKNAHVCVSPIVPSPILDCGSPTKLIEYMAMGKAAVANDHSEQRLVLAESKAGICVPYEEEAFADAIIYLLDHPREAKEMGLRGREYVRKNRSYKDTADLVERELLSLC